MERAGHDREQCLASARGSKALLRCFVDMHTYLKCLFCLTVQLANSSRLVVLHGSRSVG